MGHERIGGGESPDEAHPERAEQPGERHPVPDEIEAEHMAHAMDPHYERASKVDQTGRQALNTREEQNALEADDMITPESYEQGNADLQEQGQNEAASAIHRDVYVEEELDALDRAASSARKAGDSAGKLASQVYRRKRPNPPA
jgi:hypothetical protein